MVLPRDYTAQENLIAEWLTSSGLRYDQQYSFEPYTVDFWISELSLVIEADGEHGHLQKRDKIRDIALMERHSVEWVLHIISTTKKDIEEELWRGLNKLSENEKSEMCKINGY